MIRRLRIACVGLGLFVLPACVGNNQLSDPSYTGGGPGYVLMNRPGVPPGMYQRPGTDKTAASTKPQGTVGDQRFGPIVPENNSKPVALNDPAAAPKRLPATIESPKIGQLETPPPQIVIEPTERPVKHEQPAVGSPLTDPEQWPRVVADPTDTPKRADTPKDLIAPSWPQIGGMAAPEKTPNRSPSALPALDLPPPVQHAPPVIVPPKVTPPVDPVPPMTHGTSMKVSEPVTQVAGSASPTDESSLVRAMRAFERNRPDEAVDLLKRLDPTSQEVILYLLPVMVRLGEGNLSSMGSDELAMLVDRLQNASSMLKSKASLRIDRAIFCRGVRKFADIDPYEPRHEFRPGDMVFLYAELKNFTCEPRNQAGHAAGVSIRLGAMLELRDARNGVVWRTDLAKNDFAQTPPQDYYHTYRFCVPEKLPPGTYTLWLTVIDKPTNRAIRKPIEMRIGQG